MKAIITKRVYVPNPSRFWSKRDAGVNRFFVYILRLEKGELYVGHTRELRERMLEHRDGYTASTADKNPKLRYFETLPTRESAMLREDELKEVLKNNRRAIYRMISDFRELISEVDLS
jgi:predicted GIY-YIG superfamily endonuclease